MPLPGREYDVMTQSSSHNALAYLPNLTARKVQAIPVGLLADIPDSLAAWATRYLALAVVGVRSEEVTKKIALHFDRFVGFFLESYDHDRISACLRRDVPHLAEGDGGPGADSTIYREEQQALGAWRTTTVTAALTSDHRIVGEEVGEVGLGVEREPWHSGMGVGICPYSSGIEVELTAPDEAAS